jgi:hypothetical protein
MMRTIMKTLEEINNLLADITQQEREAALEIEYQEFLEEMHQLWTLEQESMDSWDEDARFYGYM